MIPNPPLFMEQNKEKPFLEVLAKLLGAGQ